jgi:phospholipid-binding lipoprotein MlaA
MYYFNDKFYFWLLKPVSQGYSAVVPEVMRISVSNFFYNITTPIRFVSSLLQLKMKTAGNELLRFAVNSTFGVGGLGDFAKDEMDVKRHDEDIGQAFGHHGIGHGFYIVWPILGPSSLRDTVGFVGDLFLHPVTYVSPYEASFGIRAYDEVNDTSLHIGDYEDLKKSAIDPYISIRDAYVQNRQKKVEE